MEQQVEPRGYKEIDWKTLTTEISKWQGDLVHWQMQLENSEENLQETDAANLNEKGQANFRHFAGLLAYYAKELLPRLESQLVHHEREFSSLEPLGLEPYKALLYTHQRIQEEIDVMETTLRGYLREVNTWTAIIRGKGSHEVKKMLILTDYSHAAQHACDYAITLFGDQAQEIVLLNILSSPLIAFELGEIDLDELEDHEKQSYLNEKRRLARSFPELIEKINHRHETGHIVDVVKRIATEVQTDLLVIGTLGGNGVGHSHLGSITAAIIKQVPIPTLVVPDQTPLRAPDHVMLALDPLIDEQPQHLDLFTSIHNHFGTRLDVLFITSEPKPPKPLDTIQEHIRVREILEELGLNDATQLHATLDELMEAIEHQVNERSSDLVCLLSHHHSWLHFTWGRNMATKMIFETHIPLLILHQKKHK